MFFKGFSEDFDFEFKGERYSTHKFLARNFGVLPEFFHALEAVLQQEQNALPDILTNMFVIAQSMGSKLILFQDL